MSRGEHVFGHARLGELLGLTNAGAGDEIRANDVGVAVLICNRVLLLWSFVLGELRRPRTHGHGVRSKAAPEGDFVRAAFARTASTQIAYSTASARGTQALSPKLLR